MMKRCELCKSAARMYCESDQARLCWDCDANVHSANFLVARHSRCLLCLVCQSRTAWNASGAKLGRTVSVCESCVNGFKGVKENRGGEEESGGVHDGEICTEDDEYYYDNDDEEHEEEVSGNGEDGDNQVVPWSSKPPPPAASSSSSAESSSRCFNGDGAVSLKRLRDKASDLFSDDDHGCSSSHQKNISPSAAAARDGEAAFIDSLKPLKRLRTEANRFATVQQRPAGSRTRDHGVPQEIP